MQAYFVAQFLCWLYFDIGIHWFDIYDDFVTIRKKEFKSKIGIHNTANSNVTIIELKDTIFREQFFHSSNLINPDFWFQTNKLNIDFKLRMFFFFNVLACILINWLNRFIVIEIKVGNWILKIENKRNYMTSDFYCSNSCQLNQFEVI